MIGRELGLGVGFFYRVALPGGVVGLVLLPLVARVAAVFGITLSAETPAALSFGLLIGIFLSLISDRIYEFYEGRSFWISQVRHIGVRLERRRLRGLHRRVTQAYQTDQRLYDELSQQLRQGFPVRADGQPYAAAPTAMGNILAAYESYPRLRYSMPSAFYWPRLWLRLDKDVRSEVESMWAPTDGLMHIAAGLLLAGLAYVLAALALALLPTPLADHLRADAWTTLVFGLALLALSYWPYRVSLAGHLRNGETFKAVFDVHRDRLSAFEAPTKEERETRERTWRILEHGRETAD